MTIHSQHITVDAKSRIVLPRQVRDAAGLVAGSDLVASVDESGVIRREALATQIARARDYFDQYAVPKTNPEATIAKTPPLHSDAPTAPARRG